MNGRIVWKFFGAFILLTFVTVVVLNSFVTIALRKGVEEKISDRLESNALLVANILAADIAAANRGVINDKVHILAEQLDLRITAVDVNGVVLGDSQSDTAYMENHNDRPEVVEAIADGTGHSTRFSETLGYDMKYVAVCVVRNGGRIGVVRIALPSSEVRVELNVVYRAVLMGALAAIVIALVIAYMLSRSISSPIRQMQETAERIAQGDFTKKVTVKSADELGQLGFSLNMMAEELQEQIGRLKHLDRVRADFVANVSHELKTPLTSIKGFVETLADGAIDDKAKARRFLSIIDRHADRLTNTIDDLLCLSELEQAGDCLNKSRFDLEQLIREIGLGFGHALSQKQQQLSIESSCKDSVIFADRDKIEQVFVNLIDNGIKYTENNGHINIGLSAKENTITVIVADDGMGIPEQDVERVFERFYRVDKAGSRKVGGTGLGLGIAKHIVLLHEGEIRINSAPGEGTKVFVSLEKM